MALKYYELISYCRVSLGDLTTSPTYTDDTIFTVLRVTTGFLALMGYDKGFSTTFNGIDQDLTEKEKFLYGKAVAVLIRNPLALQTAVTAINIRTEEVSYSTEAGARMVADINASDLRELRTMMFQLSDPMVARRPDYGLQLPLGSSWSGTDVISD